MSQRTHGGVFRPRRFIPITVITATQRKGGKGFGLKSVISASGGNLEEKEKSPSTICISLPWWLRFIHWPFLDVLVSFSHEYLSHSLSLQYVLFIERLYLLFISDLLLSSLHWFVFVEFSRKKKKNCLVVWCVIRVITRITLWSQNVVFSSNYYFFGIGRYLDG